MNYQDVDFYHGTGKDITSFDLKKVGECFDSSVGIYLTTNCEHDTVVTGKGVNHYEDPYSAGGYANHAADNHGGSPVVYICRLNINNPLTISDIIDSFCLDKDDPFDGQHPQDYFDMNRHSMVALVEALGKDGVILDQRVYSDEREITAIVFDPLKIDFKYDNSLKQFLSNKQSPSKAMKTNSPLRLR
jgi:hypothetical protein